MTRERAAELLELMRYQNGGCLAVGAVRPNIQAMSEEELDHCRKIWLAGDGKRAFFDVVNAIAKGDHPDPHECRFCGKPRHPYRECGQEFVRGD